MIYALEAVVDIAYNGRLTPVQSRDITKRQNIPQRYLEQVMQQLVRAQILKGVRGPKGGYRLCKERRRISIGEILLVINELDKKTSQKKYLSSSTMGEKIINPLIHSLNAEILDKLYNISLQDLCEQAKGEGITEATNDTFNYMI
jgi:Rrf2 family protein